MTSSLSCCSAALGQIVAMMLKADGVDVATHYNFGQPRIGDENYARCANSFLPTERVTHLKVCGMWRL